MSEYHVELEGKMDNQGGGHGRINKCIINPGNIHGIAKPVDHREFGAYQDLPQTPIFPYIPVYYGKHVLDSTEMIVIQDITAGMTSPCLADLKVGKRHWDLQASQEKIQGLIEKAANSTTTSLGVRVIDVKTRQNGKVCAQHERKAGLKFSPEEFSNVVHEFLPGKRLSEFHEQIVKIRDAFNETMKKFPGFRVYASSILIAYDGDNENSPLCAKLIDFAHLYIDVSSDGGDQKDPQYDDGVIDGLNSLCSITEK